MANEREAVEARARLTPERLAEIRKRVDKATAGPWTVGLDTCARCRDEGKEGEYEVLEVPSGYHAMLDRKEDAEFIANARQDIPDLLFELDFSLAENAELRKELDEYREEERTEGLLRAEVVKLREALERFVFKARKRGWFVAQDGECREIVKLAESALNPGAAKGEDGA